MQTVILRTFDNYFTANITLTRLQDLGINCYLKDEYTVTIDPILSNAIGGIKLAVDVEHAEEAVALLKQFDDDYMKAAVCPVCGKHEILSVPKQGATNFVTAILTWLFASYAVASENVYQCQHCGYESKTLPENTAQYN
ncbi:MAG: hypothetical protein ABIP30_14580 [Ferruginibacter sp.]